MSGVGSDECGAYHLTGEYMPEAFTIQFEKIYDDDEEHKIQYRGFVDSDFTEIMGDWNTGDEASTGQFEFKAVD